MIIVLMGVSGSGKTTVGILLATTLRIPFFDADHYHPHENLVKMQQGIPLSNSDREPWLNILAQLLLEKETEGGCVLACSALKTNYRKQLQSKIKEKITWIHLAGDKDLIFERLQNRSDHFMPAHLLQSQFDILEVPEDAHSISIEHHPEVIVQLIIDKLQHNI